MKRFAIILVLLGVVSAAVWWQTGRAAANDEPTSTTTFVDALSGTADEKFKRATVPNDIAFPRDLGPHPEYQTEWWYYTGNLADAAGRDFGFQFTIFRRALTPEVDETDSSWRTNQVYFVHFALSDVGAGDFYATERFSRGAASLAGAQAEPYRVWLEDWYAEEQPDGTIRLSAATSDYGLDLSLTQTLDPILHGEGGLSAKSEQPGNASYYYSQVRQAATGTVTVGDEQFDVTGKVWKDHEYSTSVLEEGATGWDWLSLQFDDGTGLMLFEIRQADGTIEPYSSGTWIDSDGTTTALSFGDWTMTQTDTWRSSETGTRYPVGWTLDVPKLDLSISGGGLMPNQELNLTSGSYWEGAVGFDGTLAGQPTAAKGYMEMTGYTEQQTR